MKVNEETPAKMFSCEYCKTLKNSLFHRTPPVAASDWCIHLIQNYYLSLQATHLILAFFRKTRLTLSTFIKVLTKQRNFMLHKY